MSDFWARLLGHGATEMDSNMLSGVVAEARPVLYAPKWSRFRSDEIGCSHKEQFPAFGIRMLSSRVPDANDRL
jgi:hypothetical protein